MTYLQNNLKLFDKGFNNSKIDNCFVLLNWLKIFTQRKCCSFIISISVLKIQFVIF